MNLTLILLWFC